MIFNNCKHPIQHKRLPLFAHIFATENDNMIHILMAEFGSTSLDRLNSEKFSLGYTVNHTINWQAVKVLQLEHCVSAGAWRYREQKLWALFSQRPTLFTFAAKSDTNLILLHCHFPSSGDSCCYPPTLLLAYTSPAPNLSILSLAPW